MMPPVRELIEISGLTARQVSRLLNVSPHSVHLWSKGLPVPEGHTGRLQHLLDAVRPLGDTPRARRVALLRSSEGPGVLHRLLDELPESQVLHPSPFSVRDHLGA